MMDSLDKAKASAERAETVGHQPTAQLKAQLAQAHAMIAIAAELRRNNDREDALKEAWDAFHDNAPLAWDLR